MFDIPYWNEFITNLKEKLSPKVFEDYFKHLIPINLESNHLRIAVPETIDIGVLRQSYRSLAEFCYQEVSEQRIEIHFEQAKPKVQSGIQPPFTTVPGVTLSRDFTFDSFVIGLNSEFAASAAMAVAHNPGGTQYNPLLIYGGSGLGKTHLLQSIGNFVIDNFPDKTVRYLSSDDFYREYIEALKEKKISEFSSYYRNHVDLLLMDDIQFLSNRMETQSEFFHIFNALHQAGKQIVLTSDSAPSEVKGLEERLISRFQWGLCVDIQPPDTETREAILRKKADLNNLDLADDIIMFIAESVEANVRLLEGVVRKLLLQSSITNKDISIEMCREIVSTSVKAVRPRVNAEEVVSVISEYFKVEVDKILGGGRGTKEVAQARQVSMYLLKEFSNLSLKSIGKRFGDRDHSTVVHALKTVQRLIEDDTNFKVVIDGLKSKLN
jgi:chromosomal replication initiator protein